MLEGYVDIDNYIRLFAPITLGFLTASTCPMSSNSGSVVKARPPAWVFRVIWPILYLLIGYVWTRLASHQYTSLVFVSNTALLALWLVFYSCNQDKRSALYLIVVILGLSVFTTIYATRYDPFLGLLVLPYMIWMILATLLSFFEFQLAN